MKFVSSFFLSLIPAIIVAAGIATLAITAGTPLAYIPLAILFAIIAGLINAIPFVLLSIIHYRRVRRKTNLKNYSFWAAYSLAMLAMAAVILLLLREVSLGRPGSQLVAAGFFFLPKVTVPVMLISYAIGWVVEWSIRRRSSTYAIECMPIRKVLHTHFSKYRVVYVVLLALLAIWTGLRFLPTIIIPLPNIHLAAELGTIKQVKRFIDKGVDVNSRNEDGETPLHMAVYYGGRSMVEFLIANGAIVDIKNNGGETPLHPAAWAGETAVITTLINYGADVNAQDNSGDTPLHEAVRKGHENTVKVLLAHGADVNIQDKNGRSPLRNAVYWGYKDLTELLIEHGAEVNVADKRGRTPLSIAIERKHKGIEKLLRHHGAKEQ